MYSQRNLSPLYPYFEYEKYPPCAVAGILFIYKLTLLTETHLLRAYAYFILIQAKYIHAV